MLADVFVRYIHFGAMLVLFSALVAQHLTYSPVMAKDAYRRLSVLDRVYGLAAVIVLVAGALLWLNVGKPAVFYSQNPLFHIKLTLFLVVALLSLPLTIFLIRNRKLDGEQIVLPRYFIGLIRAELALLLLIPLLAALMAKGISF